MDRARKRTHDCCLGHATDRTVNSRHAGVVNRYKERISICLPNILLALHTDITFVTPLWTLS